MSRQEARADTERPLRFERVLRDPEEERVYRLGEGKPPPTKS
jgi:hypothetical protein